MTDDLLDVPPVSKAPPARPDSLSLAFAAVAWCVLVTFLLGVVPRVRALYVDFGLDLPWPTALVFRSARAGLILLPIVGFLILASAYCLARSGGPGLTRRQSRWLVIVPLGLSVLVVAAVAAPILGLASRLSR